MRTRLDPRRDPFLPLIVVAASLIASAAQAQSAIGDGQRLDRNFQQGSDGRNLPRAVTDFNLRNDLVTGNVAGGAQFRGDVGYTSPRAFRGFAGSDALFQFRADSALSSLPAVLGGWTSDRFSLATDPIVPFQRDTTVAVPRSGRAGSVSDIDARALIQRSAAQGTVTQALERGADGQFIGAVRDAQGQQSVVIGSPLTGLRVESVESKTVRTMEIGLYDWRRFENDRRVRPLPGSDQASGASGDRPGGSRASLWDTLPGGDRGERLQDAAAQPNDLSLAQAPNQGLSLNPDLGRDLANSPAPTDARRQLGAGARAYDEIVSQLIDRYGQRSDVRVTISGRDLQSALRTELDRLSEELRGEAPDFDRVFPGVRDPATAALRPALASANTDQGAPGSGPRNLLEPNPLGTGIVRPTVGPETAEARGGRPGDDPTGAEAGQPGGELAGVETGVVGATGAQETAPPRMTLDELAALLRPRGTVRTLSPEQRTQVDELVARGEARLREGEFFLAEQMFDRALRIAPGHPMATVGVVHSNLGAGLYLSAAVQLRQLLVDQPAVVGLRYDPALLPPRARLEKNMEAVRQLFSRASVDRNDYALVLAYIGFQLGDDATVREGLDAIQGGDRETALRLLLKKVWLNE